MAENEKALLIGNRIKNAREYRNLSVEDLSSVFGIDPNLWKDYENGVYIPDFRLMLSLSATLNISMSYLAAENDDISKPSSVGELSENEKAIDSAKYCFSKFIDFLNQLPESEKTKLLKTIKKDIEEASK